MEKERTMLSPQDMWDATGNEKWREFIDMKDHEAAELELKEEKIAHSGEYYDWKRERGERTLFKGQWSAFLKADHYVCDSIEAKTPLSAKEYLTIHLLAAEAYSPIMKGWREKAVTWGLAEVNEEKIKNLEEKGLKVEKDRGLQGATVIVPEPTKSMNVLVQELFDEYNKKKNDDLFLAAVRLYVSLEVLHPTKDASSRTNHLILNRLLVEQGMPQAIIWEPNTPELSLNGAITMIKEASERGRTIILRLDLKPEYIQQEREKRKKEEEMQKKIAEQMKKFNINK